MLTGGCARPRYASAARNPDGNRIPDRRAGDKLCQRERISQFLCSLSPVPSQYNGGMLRMCTNLVGLDITQEN
jgi:hypothetical protein